MKKIGIIGLVLIMILFGTPLLKIKDNYQNMEYEEIGNSMLNNISTYTNSLNILATTAEKITSIGKNTLDSLKNVGNVVGNGVIGIWNWIKNKFGNSEEEKDIICTEGVDGKLYCQYEDGTPWTGNGETIPTEPCEGIECLI